LMSCITATANTVTAIREILLQLEDMFFIAFPLISEVHDAIDELTGSCADDGG
jgi:hypothetical protein